MSIIIFITAIIFGFTLLITVADKLIDGASVIAKYLGMSPLFIGLTIVAFGTSLPEIFVSITAALKGTTDIALGNAIGSNIANIGLVVGITAVIAPISVQSKTLKREFPLLLIATFICGFLLIDGDLSRLDGWLLLFILVAILVILGYFTLSNKENDSFAVDIKTEIPHNMKLSSAVIWVCVGFLALPIGANVTVYGASGLASYMGISELMIGLTVVALGTSLPELMTSVVGAIKGEHDLAIGNIIGSNIFNILAVVGLPGIISPMEVSTELLARDFAIMTLLTILLCLVAYCGKRARTITKGEGIILVLCFICYMGTIIFYYI